MAITLADLQLNVQDALQLGVIDEFRKNFWILENLTFKDCVSPTGGGGTFTYAYTRLKTQPTASFRQINTDYAPSEVKKERVTVDLKVFGGKFAIDRLAAKFGGIVDETTLQMQQKIKAAGALFNEKFITGNSATDEKEFDGIEVIVTGSSTEFIPEAPIDLSTSDAVTKNHTIFLDSLDEYLMQMDGTPTAILGNNKLIAKIRACARRASMYTTKLNAFGEQVEYYGVTALVDMGDKCGTSEPIIPIDSTTGETSLYAVRLALDGVHGVTAPNDLLITAFLPEMNKADAVQNGAVEMIAAIAVESSKSAAIIRKIKVK
ncbi:major capsid protein [Anaerorhabdus sp.]|uniref:major capsid protein n=1 Tax=Anaerorhabdus sp. TaxID=1872524 RepID=UPI002FC86B13